MLALTTQMDAGIRKLSDDELDHVAGGKSDDPVATAKCFADAAIDFARSFGQLVAKSFG